MSDSLPNYKFDEFTLNTAKRILSRKDSEIKLRDKDFDVLLFLMESAPKYCSHDEIIENVWDGLSVANNSVEKAIVNIRAALGDDSRNPRFIKTIRARGYLFVGDLDEIDKTLPEKNANEYQESVVEKQHPQKFSKSRVILISLGFIFFLGFAGLFWRKGGELWVQYNSKIIFADDFLGGEINSNLWTVRGKTVRIEDGIVKLIAEETDNEGYLESALFSFDRNKTITIKSRLKISYSKSLKDKIYFIGMFGVTPKTPLINQAYIHNPYIFGVKYTNHDYESRFSNGDFEYMKTEGFFLFKNGSAPTRKVDYRDGKVSKRIEPIWDEWFEQVIVYDPTSGEMSYTINGILREVFNVGDLLKDMDEDKLRLEIEPAGWWLYHTIEIDYIEITQ